MYPSRHNARPRREGDQERFRHIHSTFQPNTRLVDSALNQSFLGSVPNSSEGMLHVADFAYLPSSAHIQSGSLFNPQFASIAPTSRMTAVSEQTLYRSGEVFRMGAVAEAPGSDPLLPDESTIGSYNVQPSSPLRWFPPSPSPAFHHSPSFLVPTENQHIDYNASSAASGALQNTSATSLHQPGIAYTGPEYKPMPTGVSSSYQVAGVAVYSQMLNKPAVPVIDMSSRFSSNPDWRSFPTVATTTLKTRGERWNQTAPFPCMCRTAESLCEAQIAGDLKSVASHLRDAHNFTRDGQTMRCPWYVCEMEMQRRNIPRHIVTCHLAIKVFCPSCKLPLCRKDAEKKHRQACPGAKQAGTVMGDTV